MQKGHYSDYFSIRTTDYHGISFPITHMPFSSPFYMVSAAVAPIILVTFIPSSLPFQNTNSNPCSVLLLPFPTAGQKHEEKLMLNITSPAS
jgi:hypothetical protein